MALKVMQVQKDPEVHKDHEDPEDQPYVKYLILFICTYVHVVTYVHNAVLMFSLVVYLDHYNIGR